MIKKAISKRSDNRLGYSITGILLITALCLMVSCVVDPDDELAPYKGTRPLLIEKVTQSFTADIAWLGGRVAAVGVNRGPIAALDSTLVWIRTDNDNAISSYATVGTDTDDAMIESYGGTPIDRLEDDVEYTFWIAGKDLLDAELNVQQRNEYNFTDTTFAPQLFLRGRSGGGSNPDGSPVATIRVQRDEQMTGERFIILWDEPTKVRRVAIRQASTGGFTNLIYHIVTPDDEPDNITSPVIVGEPYSGTQEATPWSEGGFEKDEVYIVWMATSDWTAGTFSPSATGYAWFRLFPITD